MAEDLLSSAVTFLQDPKVADAPLAKRIAFLESKGLTSDQVQVALQRAQQERDTGAGNTTPQQPQQPSAYVPSLPPANYASYHHQQQLQQLPPPIPQRDWRDWFIMAVVSGGFSWALYFLAKRYVIPLVSPPTPSQLDADKETVTAQFDQVQEMLSILQKDTEEIRTQGTQQNGKVETALADVDTAVRDMKEKTARREADIRRLGLEMDQIREMIPKAIESVKTAQNEALNDLNGELRSLKTLLQNRIKATSGGSPFSPASSGAAKTSPATTTTSNETPAQASTASPAPSTPAAAAATTTTTSTTTTNGNKSTATATDPLARFTSRNTGGIPEWQKSVPAATKTEETSAGSSAATANNVNASE